MIANFFWMGDDFQYLNRLALLSHILVGHEVVIWLSGDVPRSKYWIGDIPKIEIKDADEVLCADTFFNLVPEQYRSKRYRLTSDMWQFAFLYEHGGLYCDVDVIALKHFPGLEWIITRDSEDQEECYALGIVKAPPKHSVFKYCINNWKPAWVNTRVYTAAIKEHGLDLTHPKETFHPFSCGEHSRYLKRTGRSILLKDGEIPDSYSVHYFANKAHKLNIDQGMVEEFPDSLLFKLSEWVFRDFPYEN